VAKFTSTRDLNIKWNGLHIQGSAGATHRLPDAYVDEFQIDHAGLTSTLTWITQDEMTAGILPATISVAGLTADNARFKGGPWYDVKAYGAVGDNVADDYAIIQSVFTAVVPFSTIYFPTGTYRISGALTLSAANVLVTGPGKIVENTNSVTLLTITGNGCQVRGLSFLQTQTGANPVAPDISNYGAAVAFKNCRSGLIEGCSISNAGSSAGYGAGIYFTGATACVARGNYLTGCNDGLQSDAFTGMTGGNVFEGNFVESSLRYGYNYDGQGANAATNRGDRVVHNMIRGGTSGIQVGAAGQGMIISGNEVRSGSATGIVLSGNTDNVRVTDNLVDSCNDGFEANGLGSYIGDLIVANNIFRRNTTDGIRTYSLNSGKFLGNDCSDNGRYGIYVPSGFSPTNLTYVGNSIARNGNDGMKLYDVLHTIISANIIISNGTASSGLYDGLVILATGGTSVAVTDLIVQGNQFTSALQGSASQRYCINFSPTTASNVNVFGNVLAGFTSAAISSGWAGLLASNNIGYSKTDLAFVGARVWSDASTNMTSGSFYTVSFNTDIKNPQNYHSIATNPTRLTVPTGYAGYHVGFASIQLGAITAGKFLMAFRVNGTETCSVEWPGTAGNARKFLGTTPPIYMNDGDYLELEIFQNSGLTLTMNTSAGITPIFGITRLGI
jgi:hypothetical protein